MNYMLYDELSGAVHHVYAFVDQEAVDQGSDQLARLLSTASWIPAVEPQL